MNVASMLVVSMCAVAFAGCVLKGPELRVQPPVEVKVKSAKGSDKDGSFCPPGQAKKGRC